MFASVSFPPCSTPRVPPPSPPLLLLHLPPQYFWNHDYAWNTFDFFIVLLAAPFFQFGDADVAVLRLLRLSRVVKLLNKIPQLQMIVMGLIGGLKSIAYIVSGK